MDIPIAITTYKNYELLKNCTLTFLAKYKYPSELINIFVQSEEEEAKYRKVIPKIFFNKIIVADKKSINKYYKQGEIVICMEDNVKDVKSPYLTFNQIVLYAKSLFEKEECALFGIMPHDDVKGMVNSYSTHLEYVNKYFYICRNHRDFEVSLDEKEDYERTILYYLYYGKVVRYRGAGISLEHVNRDEQKALKEMQFLSSKYPMMCRVIKYDGIPSLMMDIQFKKS